MMLGATQYGTHLHRTKPIARTHIDSTIVSAITSVSSRFTVAAGLLWWLGTRARPGAHLSRTQRYATMHMYAARRAGRERLIERRL